jgi:hypothetical protein
MVCTACIKVVCPMEDEAAVNNSYSRGLHNIGIYKPPPITSICRVHFQHMRIFL